MCIAEALRLIAKGNPDMNKAMREDLKDEFKKFKVPENFGGGCKKSSVLLGYCGHLMWDGTLSKAWHNCPDYERCKGYKFTFKV